MTFQSAFHALADGRDDGLFLRELTGLEFRIDEFAVHRDLEATAAGGDERELFNFLLVGREQRRRQTDGFRFVPSDRTEFQLDVHDVSLGEEESGRAGHIVGGMAGRNALPARFAPRRT